MNIGKVNKILEEKFPIKEWESKVQDSRKQPVIPSSTIFKLTREMVLFGQKSSLEVDLFSRLDSSLKWHQSNREMVASDTTIPRVLEGFDCDSVRGILSEAYMVLEGEDTFGTILPSGRRIKIGIVDGSEFGGFLASVLIVVGGVNAPIDVELYSQGKELSATKIVLNRARDKLGRGFVEIILGDGLYINQYHLSQCKYGLGCEALVKTEDESLTIIQDAKGLFFRMESEAGDGIERVEGVDHNRCVRYKIIAGGSFRWQGLPFKLKVAYVWEEKLKPIKGRPDIEEFWVITTDESLTAEDMRELAHLRWEIENNLFKKLNTLVGSKRRNANNEKVKESFLLIWFVGFILLGFYIMCRKLKGESIPRESWKWVTQLLFLSLGSLVTTSPG
jgi:hypothetical protein